MRKASFYWVVNIDRCIGCETCVLACKQERQPVKGVLYRRIHHINPEQYPAIPSANVSLACNHCEKPACLKGCPAKAYRQENGVVLQEPAKCIGCRYCVWICPYDAPQYVEAKGKVEKCDLCIHRLRKGLTPACVDACPTGALRLLEKLEELPAETALVKEIPGLPDAKTLPKLRFITARLMKFLLGRELK